MNSLYYVLLLGLALAVHGETDVSTPSSDDSSIAPSIDLCQLVNDHTAFGFVVKCMLSANELPCSPSALVFKLKFSNMINDIHGNWSQKDKNNARCFMIGLRSTTFQPQYLIPMKEKYDPSGENWDRLEAYLGIPGVQSGEGSQ